MGEVISICMKEIFDADILFLKNDFILRGSNNNFSYILWYNKSNERIIVGKSRLNSMTTSIEYLTSYNGIDDYYKKDLCKNKEHLKYFADGLFDEVYKFFEKNNKTEILEMLNEEKRIHIDRVKEEGKRWELFIKNQKEKDEETKARINTSERIPLSKEEMSEKLKSKIYEIKERNEKIDMKFVPKFEEIKEHMKNMNYASEIEIEQYAKEIINLFWNGELPNEKEVEQIVEKIIY
jgi:hypothetical protein